MSTVLITDPTHGPPQWWDERAACNESADPDAWFVIEDTPNDEIVDPIRLAYALDTCRACPIRVECGTRARPDDFGIWGGRTASERRA